MQWISSVFIYIYIYIYIYMYVQMQPVYRKLLAGLYLVGTASRQSVDSQYIYIYIYIYIQLADSLQLASQIASFARTFGADGQEHVASLDSRSRQPEQIARSRGLAQIARVDSQSSQLKQMATVCSILHLSQIDLGPIT